VSWSYLNDSFVKKEDVKISPFDRGFLFGDGVYELIPVYRGKLFLYDEHIARLVNSLESTKINPPKKWKEFRTVVEELIQKNGYENQAIYIQITRGVEEVRDHAPNHQTVPTLFINSTELTLDIENKKNAKQEFSVKAQEDMRWSRCDIKAITLLGNVMSLNDTRIDEVVYHKEGLVTEGAKSNIFCVLDGIITTPAISNDILGGITRQYFIDLFLKLNINVVEREITLDELLGAEEVWFSNSSKVLRLVTNLNGIDLNPDLEGSLYRKACDIFLEEIKNY
tara:strand:+ start:1043 stop:1885 length:843 start_codon:yes stop_codon:yes gene_type:complete